MAAITTRAGKGSPLTNAEMDANLNNMNAAIGGTLTTIASATTPDIFVVTSGPIIDYTGTATCTGFVAAPQAGATRTLVCAGAAVFTAGANMLIDGVASGSNLTAVAQDKVIVTAVTTTQFRLSIVRYAGVVSTSDLQVQLITAFTTAGTSTAYTLTPTPAITANTTNQRFRVKFNAASGATPTLAVSGQTAKNLKYYDAAGAKQAIAATQVPINWLSDVEYDGTDWVVLQPCNIPAGFSTVSLTAGNITTSSTNLVDLTGATLTLTTTRGGPLAFAFECTETNTTANAINTFNVNIDGTLLFGTGGIGASEVDTASDEHHMSLSGITAALAAGSHTIKVQWKTNNGASTATVFSGAANAIRFSAWEI